MQAAHRSRLLRPWYLWSILLLALVSVLLGWGAYKLPMFTPQYRSDGQIRIKPALEPLLFPIPESVPIPDYDQYIESQVLAIKGQRTILKAMGMSRDDLGKMKADLKVWDDRAWSDVAGTWGTIGDDEARARFAERLQATHLRGTQVIQISFTDSDPALAAVAVKLTIAAYKKLYDVDVQNMADRLARLVEKHKDLQKRVDVLKDSIIVALGTYSTEEFLQRTVEARQTEQLNMEKALGSVEMQLQGMAYRALARAEELFRSGKVAEAQSMLNGVQEVWPDLGMRDDSHMERLRQLIAAVRAAVPAATSPLTMDNPFMENLTPELLASQYPPLQDALRNRAEAQRQYSIARTSNAETSAAARMAKTNLDTLQGLVDDTFDQARKAMKTAATQSGGQPAADKITLAGARDMLRLSREQVAAHKNDLMELQKRAAQVANIKADLEAPQQELNQVERAIRELQFESVTSGRTEVLSPGDLALRPEKDRRLPIALATGAGTLLLGLIILTTIALLIPKSSQPAPSA